jgi:glycosyltransferase involved in cell wall biosynthesis
MLISIITVSLNAAPTIARTLISVSKQSHLDIEYIVVDGNSSDGTLAIIQDFAKSHSNIRLISESDKGIYDAMNRGIKLATGDVIGIINADDYYADQNVISDIGKLFQAQDLDAVFGDLEYFDAGNEAHITRVYRSKGFHHKKLSRGIMPAHPTLFLRKSVYDRFGLFKPEYKIAGDFDFIARIFKNGDLKYAYLPRILTRMQSGGVSTRGIKSTILLNKEILRSCQENQIPTNFFKLLLRYPQKLLEYVYK